MMMMMKKKVLKKAQNNYRNYLHATIDKVKPEKSLTSYHQRSYGRNNSGSITVRHKFSGGNKKLYRTINFKRDLFDQEGKVMSIQYDPYRTAFIALIKYESKKEYIICPNGLKKGDSVISSLQPVELSTGNCTQLKNLPQGTIVHNIEMYPGRGGKIARSAGSCAEIVSHVDDYAIIKLSSGFMIKVKLTCKATVGQVSNLQNKNIILHKAGNNYHRGIRPTVRGVAMNPVDHPHGGGEGRTGVKRHPVSYTCRPTKGYKTTKSAKLKNKRIMTRKKKK